MDQPDAGWSDAKKNSVRTQLERMITSELFSHGARQVRFLTFIVETTLEGQAHRLNQYAVGIEVFDRDEEFDPSVDAIVRVEAGRLRAKLTEYYAGPGHRDPVVISMPKGGYGVAVAFRESANTTAAHSQPVQAARQNLIIGALLTAILVSSVYVGFFRDQDVYRSEPVAGSSSSQPAIAVLPFDNMSADPEQEYFSDGITEDIITDLSILSNLTVIARHSTFVYKDRAVSIDEVGRDLGVQYVLEGSVRKDADRLRINAQLIDVSTEGHIWAERFDRNLDDVFAVQDEVTSRIVDALELTLNSVERDRLGHRGTESVEAHDLLLRGQEQFYRFAAESVDNAISLFERARSADSAYAEAHAWQSRALVYARISGINNSHTETIEAAVALAEDAIELNDMLPIAHANHGWALRWDDKKHQAINALSRAIELDPNYADAYPWQSLILSSVGDGEDAMLAIENSIRLDPNYSVTHVFALGRAHLAMGDYDEALAHFDRGLARNPNFIPNHVYRLFVLESQGQHQAAAAAENALANTIPNYAQSAAYQTYLAEREALAISP